MDIIFNIVLPIAGFILAIVGAWDKLVISIQFYKTKRAERELKRVQKQLQEIERFESNSSYLIAYLFKQLFFLLVVIFFVSVSDIAPPEKIAGNEVRIALTGILCWLAGFFTGNAIRVTNYVLKADNIKRRLTNRIKQCEISTNKLIQSTANASTD